MLKRLWRSGWLAAVLISAAAAALRLIDLGAVRLDPFYDAAVKSMGLSWHNFFLGVFEPGGSVAIDKPPLDLWLQVASVKLFGWNSISLKLPEALAGTLSIPLLFAAVRRPFGVAAGLAAALAMAVMPVEVITARSDTMDAVMMALITLALLCLVRAAESNSTRWLLAAAAALGLAFNVKLVESFVALPGLALIAVLALPAHGGRLSALGRRSRRLAAGVSVYVIVALCWLTATLLVPASQRPYAIGSTEGSAWNAAFVFNGLDRLSGKTVEGTQPGFQSDRHYPQATQAERDSIPITPPSATRLLTRVGPLPGQRLGLMVLVALLLGAPAIALSLRGPPSRRAIGAGLLLWLLTGVVLFSSMARLHPRYVEGFTPAVAALLGIGAAWATSTSRTGGRPRWAWLAMSFSVLLIYARHLLYGTNAIWWLTLGSALTALALCGLPQLRASRRAEWPPSDRPAQDAVSHRWLRGLSLAGALVALLAIPLQSSIQAIKASLSDAGAVGALRASELLPMSAYLKAHQDGARYEVVADSATKIAALIVRDVRPLIVLTSYNSRQLTSVHELKRLILRGEVRYAFLDSACGPHTPRTDADCSPAALWVHAHAIDISRTAGLPRGGLLWRLPRSIA